MAVSPREAADLYRSGLSACLVAAQLGITRSGAETAIRKGGINGGLQWCREHRALEELK